MSKFIRNEPKIVSLEDTFLDSGVLMSVKKDKFGLMIVVGARFEERGCCCFESREEVNELINELTAIRDAM